MKSLVTFLAMLAAVSLSWAGPVTYSYTGNTYNQFIDDTPPAGTNFNTTQRISGSLTFSSALPDQAFGVVIPLSFTFSDGVTTLSSD